MLAVLRCPADKAELRLTDAEPAAGDVETGTLTCNSCARRYPIVEGVPDFVEPEESVGHVARSFGFEWEMHHRGGFEEGTVFGLTVDQDVASFYEGLQLTPDDLGAKVVLDAGCGSGTLTSAIARQNPSAQVIGLDVNAAIWHLRRHSRGIANLNLVRASIFELPLADGSIDVIWCNGVLHHTGDTRRAFTELVSKAARGGRAYVWLYEKKFSPLVGLRHLLRPLGVTNWDHRVTYRFCQAISAPTWLAVRALNLLRSSRFASKNTHVKILTRKRGYRELVLTWFDVMSPRYRDTYRIRDLRRWFTEAGFGDLADYWWPVGVSGTRSPSPADTATASAQQTR